MSINVLEIVDDEIEHPEELKDYFENIVKPLAADAVLAVPQLLVKKLEKETRDAGVLAAFSDIRGVPGTNGGAANGTRSGNG